MSIATQERNLTDTEYVQMVVQKMREYIENGTKMGLLADPEQRRLHVYRRRRKIQIHKDPQTFSCDPVLPGFVLDLREIW